MSVLLSKKHGLNPTMALCRLCEKETGEILLLGKSNEYKCPSCGFVLYGRLTPKDKICTRCGGQLELIAVDVAAPMQLRSIGLCEECAAKREEHTALVRQGGIYWRCQICGSSGVIRPGTEFALMVRHKTQIVAPNPVGVDFTSEECPVCQGKIGENDGPDARSKSR
jgi:rubrerythrin